MKKLLVITAIAGSMFMYACGGGEHKPIPGTEPKSEASTENENPSYDPERGEGKFKDVNIPPTIDAAKASAGQEIYNVKCASCHKLSDEKLVGPGWAGVTSRHKPEWILNFITNPDEMIDKDPKAQAMLEICMVRMPNQNLNDEEAFKLYEFMRKNDAK